MRVNALTGIILRIAQNEPRGHHGRHAKRFLTFVLKTAKKKKKIDSLDV